MSTYRLDKILEPSNNNFNLVRLLATLSVVWGHQPLHFGQHAHIDSFAQFVGIEYEGSLAVYSFFLLSGILISKSYSTHPSVTSFLTLRFARIWPAAAICSVAVLLVYGPLANEGSAASFLSDPFTWNCLQQNLTIVAGTCWSHPLLFRHASVATSWNNPLWTLPLEVHCYLVVLVLGSLGILRRSARVAIACTLLMIAFLWIARTPPENTFLWFDFVKLGGYSFYPIPFFLLGMLLYTYRSNITLNPWVAWALIALYATTAQTVFGHVVLYPTLVYAVLTFSASRLIKCVWSPRNDYSYGIYIYGFVVGQSLSNYYPNIDGWFGIAITFAITILLAALSWHFVERPALRLAHRMVLWLPPVEARFRTTVAAHRMPLLAAAAMLIISVVAWRRQAEADQTHRMAILDQVQQTPPMLMRAPEGLFAHAPSKFSIPTAGATTLSVSFGIRDGAWREGASHGVCFRATQADELLWERCLDPKVVDGDRGEQGAVIALPPESTEVELETACLKDCAWAWSYWSAAILDNKP